MLEPLLHRHKLALGAMCFAVRTGNTFLGSLLWVICTLRRLSCCLQWSVHLLYCSLQVGRLCQVDRHTIGASIEKIASSLSSIGSFMTCYYHASCNWHTTCLLHGRRLGHVHVWIFNQGLVECAICWIIPANKWLEFVLTVCVGFDSIHTVLSRYLFMFLWFVVLFDSKILLNIVECMMARQDMCLRCTYRFVTPSSARLEWQRV